MDLVNCAAQIEKNETVSALWGEIVCVLSKIGITHVIWVITDTAGGAVSLLCNVDGIYDEGTPTDSPFLQHCCISYDVTYTGIDFMEMHDFLDADDRDLIERAGALGFRTGIGIPMRLQGSERYGGFNLGTGMDRDEFMRRIAPRAEELRLFCLLMHRRIEELSGTGPAAAGSDFAAPLIAPALPEVFDALTPREREVMYLLAQGASRKETAYICGISTHTVAEYAKGAYRKLGVRNRVQVANMIFGGQPPQ